MQEKPASVFLAATANRIQQLPAELMRKGRFDQLFFLDLPTSSERAQIFAIHIRLNGQNPEGFDIDYLAAATKGWSGAEIESAVKAARIEAWQEGRAFNEQACLRPRDRFWDIPVPKIDSAFDNLFVPQPSWSPSTTQQLRKLVAAPYLAPI